MTLQRRQELIRAEALRHCNLARLDEPRRREHLEVAEALTWAARELEEPRLKVGDKIIFAPSAFSNEVDEEQEGGKLKKETVEGRIVYIHPKRRYFTVEAMVNGQIIRESLKIK